jgi:hypothetical protein
MRRDPRLSRYFAAGDTDDERAIGARGAAHRGSPNLTAPHAVLGTPAEPARLDHGRSCHPDCSALDHPGGPTSLFRGREPGASAAVGCLPSHPPEAERSLARPAVLDRPQAGLAGLGVAWVIVRPATVIAWHRRGVAWYWTRRSRPRAAVHRSTPTCDAWPERWPERTRSGARRAFTEGCRRWDSTCLSGPSPG